MIGEGISSFLGGIYTRGAEMYVLFWVKFALWGILKLHHCRGEISLFSVWNFTILGTKSRPFQEEIASIWGNFAILGAILRPFRALLGPISDMKFCKYVLMTDQNYGAVEYWQKNEWNLPIISRLAKVYLVLSASSVPVECLSSTMGLLLDRNDRL